MVNINNKNEQKCLNLLNGRKTFDLDFNFPKNENESLNIVF